MRRLGVWVVQSVLYEGHAEDVRQVDDGFVRGISAGRIRVVHFDCTM
jgi:hypothetical protein